MADESFPLHGVSPVGGPNAGCPLGRMFRSSPQRIREPCTEYNYLLGQVDYSGEVPARLPRLMRGAKTVERLQQAL